jgi:AGZA family xanthine/uracil permease-like MFS transporter
MGIFNVLGSLQNIESAAAAGDSFPTAASLAMNGVGTIAAALFGSCFPTTLYIGHPGWKALGARAGYSILNAALFTVLCLTGSLAFVAWLVPIEAGMAIVLWIGIMMAAQSFEATPRHHAPAVVMGLLPGLDGQGWPSRGPCNVLARACDENDRDRQLHRRWLRARAGLHLHGHDPVCRHGPSD